MRLFLFFSMILPFMLFSCGQQYHLKSEEGNFSVNFPGKPAENKLKLPTAEGNELEIVSYTYLSPDSNSVFILSYNEIPDYAAANPDSILQKAKMGPAQNMRTSIVEEKKIEVQGFPGLYFKGLGLDIAMVYYIYIVKDKMYQLAILNSEPREPDNSEINGFMKTFKLLKNP
jgi:hypothetical protein